MEISEESKREVIKIAKNFVDDITKVTKDEFNDLALLIVEREINFFLNFVAQVHTVQAYTRFQMRTGIDKDYMG